VPFARPYPLNAASATAHRLQTEWRALRMGSAMDRLNQI
jgi:hypothetical protein